MAEKPTKDRTAGTGESASLRCQGSHSASLCIKRVESIDYGSGIAGYNGGGKYDGEESAEREDNILGAEHFEIGLGERENWGERVDMCLSMLFNVSGRGCIEVE